MASWRALGGAAGVAIAATSIVAGVVHAAPATTGPATPASRPVIARDAADQAATALAVVTEHDLDGEVLSALEQGMASGGQTVVQEIQLAVIGGPITLETTSATVTLERVPGTRSDWVGDLPPVRVVDARGTHAGWDVRWSLDSLDVDGDGHVPAAKVQVEPGAPVVVHGVADGLESGKLGPAVRHGRTLFRAAPGGGGGTYEAGGTVRLRLPASVEADSVVVHLAFTLV